MTVSYTITVDVAHQPVKPGVVFRRHLEQLQARIAAVIKHSMDIYIVTDLGPRKQGTYLVRHRVNRMEDWCWFAPNLDRGL